MTATRMKVFCIIYNKRAHQNNHNSFMIVLMVGGLLIIYYCAPDQ